MSIPRRFPSKRPRRGMVTVQLALALTALMGVVSIVADGGILLAQRRHAQATADAAALAAAADLYENFNTNGGVDGGSASTSALATASANGYKNDAVAADGTGNAATTSTVVVQMYPNNYLGGPNAGTAVPKGYAEATVTYYQGRGFSAVFGSGTIPISARAVARGTWYAASSAGLILLDRSASKALDITGNGNLAVSSGGIIVDSNSSTAVFNNGNGTITATYANVTGNVKNPSGVQTSPGTLSTGVAASPDPLASIPEPTLTFPSTLTAGTITSTSNGNGGKQYTLSPGIYGSGGTTLPNFGSNDTIIFQQASAGNSGIYYLASGGFNFSGLSVQMAPGTGGLMFYNAGTTSSDSFNLSVSSNSTASNMSPLTSGIYQGISYFQNRLGTQGLSLAGNGTATLTISGTYYAVGGTLTLTGNGNSTFGSQVIVDQMKLSGNGASITSYNSNSVGMTRAMSLVE